MSELQGQGRASVRHEAVFQALRRKRAQSTASSRVEWDHALFEELKGDGPILRDALGRDATKKLEAAIGVAAADEMPFFYAVREDGILHPEPPPLKIGESLIFAPPPAEVQRMAVFMPEGKSLRAVMMDELRSHFRRVIGEPPQKQWSNLPRAKDVALGDLQPDQKAQLAGGALAEERRDTGKLLIKLGIDPFANASPSEDPAPLLPASRGS